MSEGLHICRGVTDIGTGLQAVAAAITDPDTISAYQTETRDGSMSNRTFYGGVHEMAGGVHDAAGGINELGMVCQAQLIRAGNGCMKLWAQASSAALLPSL